MQLVVTYMPFIASLYAVFLLDFTFSLIRGYMYKYVAEVVAATTVVFVFIGVSKPSALFNALNSQYRYLIALCKESSTYLIPTQTIILAKGNTV